MEEMTGISSIFGKRGGGSALVCRAPEALTVKSYVPVPPRVIAKSYDRIPRPPPCAAQVQLKQTSEQKKLKISSKLQKHDNENQKPIMKTNPLHLPERRNSRKARTNGKQEERKNEAFHCSVFFSKRPLLTKL
jgi:hypothetical protein